MHSSKALLNILRNRGTLLFSTSKNLQKTRILNIAQKALNLLQDYKPLPYPACDVLPNFYNLPVEQFNIILHAGVQFKIDPSQYALIELSEKFNNLLSDLNQSPVRWTQYLLPEENIREKIILTKLALNSCNVLNAYCSLDDKKDDKKDAKNYSHLTLSSLETDDYEKIIFAAEKFNIDAERFNLAELYNIFNNIFDKLHSNPQAYKDYLPENILEINDVRSDENDETHPCIYC